MPDDIDQISRALELMLETTRQQEIKIIYIDPLHANILSQHKISEASFNHTDLSDLFNNEIEKLNMLLQMKEAENISLKAELLDSKLGNSELRRELKRLKELIDHREKALAFLELIDD